MKNDLKMQDSITYKQEEAYQGGSYIWDTPTLNLLTLLATQSENPTNLQESQNVLIS